MKSVKRSAAINIMSSCTPVFVLNLSLCLKIFCLYVYGLYGFKGY